jgi:Ring finger domain
MCFADDVGDTRDIQIPSTFIPHAIYLSLSFLLSLPSPLDIIISPSTASDWPLLDTLLLVVLSPLFTLACIYFLLIIRRRVQRRRELAPLSVVKSLPHRRWTNEKDDEENGPGTSGANRNVSAPGSMQPDSSRPPRRVNVSECVVCLEDFVEGDILITLPCNHEFHESCMYLNRILFRADLGSTPWLTTRRRLCPICKRDIITPPQSQQTIEELSEQSPLLTNRDDEWRGDTAASV